MKAFAILIAASPNEAFYSQIAAMAASLRTLDWKNWKPIIYAYFCGDQDLKAFANWEPYLRDVVLVHMTDPRFTKDDLWAQSDAVFELAPRNADVLIAMDADTLPVTNFEDVLDRVAQRECTAGVIAHFTFPQAPDVSAREGWAQACEGVCEAPLDFAFRHTLMEPDSPPDALHAPFYLNMGVVFFSKHAFDEIATRYLAMRPKLVDRMFAPDFSGQVALTFATAAAGVETWSMPMRYNYPNDPIADRLHPGEREQAVIYHYLRTEHFDRHRIFTSAAEYERFMASPLTGVNRDFQDAVRKRLGDIYPFQRKG